MEVDLAHEGWGSSSSDMAHQIRPGPFAENSLLPSCWSEILKDELEEDYFSELMSFISEERARGIEIFPPAEHVFAALWHTRFDAVKVVILGQDPYHGPGQAHGLAFSVPAGIPVPPSLRNISKELLADLGRPLSSSLIHWAEQGVLLLNAVLTVESGKAASHAKRGWERFTDRIISELATRKEHLVFILWGSSAQAKAAAVDPTRHLVLKSAHPSPLSAHRGFFGSRPFSATNEYLEQHSCNPILW